MKEPIWGFLLLSLCLTCPITSEAQEVEQTYDSACTNGQPCDGVCTFDWRPYYEKVVRFHDLLEGPRDYKTARLEDFRKDSELLKRLRETWYLRKDNLVGQTGPLYRCLNSTIPDYRDSASPSEGTPAYDCFFRGAPNITANPWLDGAKVSRTPLGSSTSGLQPLRRYLKSSGTDYRTWLSATLTGYVLDFTYSGSNARLGYERFGKLLEKAQVLGTGESSGYGVNYLKNGTLRVDFNRTWGNAIGKITQMGTTKQIVSEPIGDMVQSVVRFDAGDPDCRVPNPTQSGGAQCVSPDYSLTTRWAGSPVISTTRTGTVESAPQTLTSVVRPFDFCHNGKNPSTNARGEPIITPPWAGTTDTDPLAWNGFTERSDTLSCKLGTNMRKEILRTVSRYQLAGTHTGSVTKADVINTHWLKPKDLVAGTPTATVWDFKIYCKNLETGEVRQMMATANGKTQVNGPDDASCGAPPGTTADNAIQRARHAIIASRTDGSFAYAVARLTVPPGGYTNVKFRCAAGLGCNDSTKGTVIIQANTKLLQLSKTQWSAPQESFLVVGTKAAIMDGTTSRLAELNAEALAGGVNCQN